MTDCTGRRRRLQHRLATALVAMLLATVGHGAGLVVSDVATGSEAAFASLRAGDVVDSARVRGSDDWQRLITPFDLDALQSACGEGCVVELRGQRQSTATTWYVRAGDWLLTTEPVIAPTDNAERSADVIAWGLSEAIARAAAIDDWDTVNREIDSLRTVAAPTARLAATTRSIGNLADATNGDALLQLLALALSDLERADIDAAVRWQAVHQLATYFARRGELEQALEHVARLDASLASVSLSSPLMADIETLRGSIARSSGDLDAAREYFYAALAVLDRLAGRTAASRFHALRGLGIVTTIQGDFAAAERHSIDALQLIRSLQDQRSEARLLNNIGILYVRRGDMGRAEHYYQQAMTLNKAFGAWLSYSYNLANLGDLAIARQDPETAAELFATARETILQQAPDGSDA
ncbi:MAG: tetratricopeptide repeat protein, partial [Pseudomonadota bacterium]